MVDHVVTYSSLLMSLGITIQGALNIYAMKDVNSFNIGVVFDICKVLALVSALILSIYSIRLAASRMVLKRISSPDLF